VGVALILLSVVARNETAGGSKFADTPADVFYITHPFKKIGWPTFKLFLLLFPLWNGKTT